MNSHFAPARFAVLLCAGWRGPSRGRPMRRNGRGGTRQFRPQGQSSEPAPAWSCRHYGRRSISPPACAWWAATARSTTTMAKPTPPDAGQGAVDEWVEIDFGGR